MYLNGEKVVDNNGCHGEQERGSGDKFLKPGAHDIVVDMCERGGGEVLKMRWKGPDSGNSKVKIPATALKHEKAESFVLQAPRLSIPSVAASNPRIPRGPQVNDDQPPRS